MRNFAELHERARIAAFDRRHITHDELRCELGLNVGDGPTPVLVRSRMHGDEGTGSRARAGSLEACVPEPGGSEREAPAAARTLAAVIGRAVEPRTVAALQGAADSPRASGRPGVARVSSG